MKLFSGKKENINKALIEQIILEKYNQYYRLAFKYTHNETDACDIVQNGAYKAIKGSHTLKQPEYAQTWIYRIMLNECFRHLRQPKHISYEAAQDFDGIKTEYTEDSYRNIDLERAIDALPDRDKAVVIMKYFEDKKLEEIAYILDENVNTIKSRLYRCMKKLRTTLSDTNNSCEYSLNNGMGG